MPFIATDLMPGTVLADRYRLNRIIGRGGMGVVWQAFDAELDEPVAIKALEPSADWNAAALERFKREIKLARRILHRNICRIHDLGSDGDLKFVTMELIDGCSLDRLIVPPTHLDRSARLEIFRDILLGVRAAHAAGIVHQDLKPANVMIASDHRTVIMDFGIAGLSGRAAAGDLLGTPAYMAPERFAGEAPDPRSDLYSLGVTLFELMGNRRPFDCDSDPDWRNAHRNRIPPSLRLLDPSIPALIVDVVQRMLAKNPSHRPTSAEEVLDELAAVEAHPDKGRVLLAESDPSLARLLQLALSQIGAEVKTVSDGEQAIEQILRTRPNLLCLDLRLPKIDGFRVIEYIRSSRRARSVPVFLMTPIADRQNEAWARHLGVERLYHKPFSVRSLARDVAGRLAAA